MHKVRVMLWQKSYLEAAKLAFDLDMRRQLIFSLKEIAGKEKFKSHMIFNEDEDLKTIKNKE